MDELLEEDLPLPLPLPPPLEPTQFTLQVVESLSQAMTLIFLSALVMRARADWIILSGKPLNHGISLPAP